LIKHTAEILLSRLNSWLAYSAQLQYGASHSDCAGRKRVGGKERQRGGERESEKGRERERERASNCGRMGLRGREREMKSMWEAGGKRAGGMGGRGDESGYREVGEFS
jgi:hypothetical protein